MDQKRAEATPKPTRGGRQEAAADHGKADSQAVPRTRRSESGQSRGEACLASLRRGKAIREAIKMPSHSNFWRLPVVLVRTCGMACTTRAAKHTISRVKDEM